MRRSKRIYILLGVLAAACIATFAVMRVEEHQEKIKNSDEVVLEISGDSVTSLSWEYESETLSFHKDEEWVYDEDEDFPVDEEKINELLKQFEEFGVSFIIEEVEDYGQYGLDDPICTIHLETEDESYEILLGNYSNMDSERYVSIGDGNVYLVQNDPLDSFDATIREMIDNDEAPSFDAVSEIQFSGSETYQVAYEEDSTDTYCDEDVYFTQKDGSSLPLDTSKVDSYLSSISDLDLTDYMTYTASDEDLTTYGLDDPELTVTVDYTSEDEEGEEYSDTFVLHLSRDPKERKNAEKQEDTKKDSSEEDEDEEEEEITAYARVGESSIIYQITSDEYKELIAASRDDLRHDEVLSAEFNKIKQIDISLEGASYTITSKGKGEKRTYYYQGEKLEMEDLRDAVENLQANSFTDEQPTQKEEVSLTVYLDGDNDPKIQIELYRYDGSDCLAVVDGEPVSLIDRSSVVDLIEAIHAIVLD